MASSVIGPHLFQSTRPRGARLFCSASVLMDILFQSTRPRGARRRRCRSFRYCCRFNPRAHAGRDAPGSGPADAHTRFQSTRPRGARPFAVRHRSTCSVSIHAPTRGATLRRGNRQRRLWFQSTRPRGARLASRFIWDLSERFQSTRPRGARRN